jgi:hypothetical protein
MSKIEAAVRVIIEFSEAFNRHDVAGMMQLVADSCIIEHYEPAPDGAIYSGKESIAQFWDEYFTLAPEAFVEIEELSGLRERSVMRWKLRWNDPVTGERYVRGVHLFKVRDGAIREQLSYTKG